MRRSRVPIAEKRATESKTKYNSSQRKMTSVGPRITKKNLAWSTQGVLKRTRRKRARKGNKRNPPLSLT